MEVDGRIVIVGFSKPRKSRFPIFSWAVRKFQRTKYSHTYVRWFSQAAENYVAYHASGSHVHFLCKKIFDQVVLPIEEYEIKLTQDQYRRFLKFCLNHAGIDYGINGVIGIGLVDLRETWKDLTGQQYEDQNPFASGLDTQWCSKLIGSLLTEIGVITKNDWILELSGPREINKIIKNHPSFKKIL